MLWSSISISVKHEMVTLSFDWHVPTTEGGWIKIRKCQKKIGYKTLAVMRVLNVEFWRFMKTLWTNAVCCYQVTCILMLCNYNSSNRNIQNVKKLPFVSPFAHALAVIPHIICHCPLRAMISTGALWPMSDMFMSNPSVPNERYRYRWAV